MTDTAERPKPEIVMVPKARLAFARLEKPVQGTDAAGNPRGKAKYSCTLLLDPSDKEQNATIAKIKAAATKVVTAKWGPKESWPKANPATGMGGLIACFGNGNDLPKVYDGYKDRFYVKCSDTTAPQIGSRRGKQIVYDQRDNQWHVFDKEAMRILDEVVSPDEVPYSGCFVRASISPWVYFPSVKNPQSANGFNMNLRMVQFLEPGQGFAGRRELTAEEALTQMAGDTASTATADDAW